MNNGGKFEQEGGLIQERSLSVAVHPAMKLKEATQEALCDLRLSDLPEEWANSLWDGNFCQETVSLPFEAVEEDTLLCEESWERLLEACSLWSLEKNRSEGKRCPKRVCRKLRRGCLFQMKDQDFGPPSWKWRSPISLS